MDGGATPTPGTGRAPDGAGRVPDGPGRVPDGPARGLAATPGGLLALIRSRAVWTRQQLLDTTGMSRPTLLERLAPLLSAGLVHESGASSSTGGRPARLLRFDDRRLAVLTVDVGHRHVTASITNIYGKPLRHRRRTIDVTSMPPDEILGIVESLADDLLAADGTALPVGVGMGLPAPIVPDTALPGPTPVMPGWDSYPLRTRLARRWPLPLILENDARAVALGEASVRDARTVLVVKWSNGIGAGLVVDGTCLTGEDGAAGDIGHTRISPDGPLCRCGRQGCLAGYAAGYSLVQRLRAQGVASMDELSRRATDGDPLVTAELVAAAGHVGTVLSALIAMLNPRTLVLGGTLGRLPVVVDAVSAAIRQNVLRRSTDSLRIEPARLGDRAATVGLARLVADHVLAPDAVDRALAADGALPGWPASR